MVYLKPLYRRLNRLAQRQSSAFSMEAQQEHVKILIFKISYIFIKKIGIEKYWVYIIVIIRVYVRSSGGQFKILLIDF